MRHLFTKKLFTIFSLLLCAASICRSQDNLHFEHFTSENGLSENFVYTVFQDKKGFLWIGTHDGLNRYDGYSFKKFRHDPGDSNSLSDNTIYSICEDGQGNIWMGTNAGLCKYDPSTGAFTAITLNKKLKIVEQLMLVNQDELMLRHERILCLINTITEQEIPLNYKDSSGLHPLLFQTAPLTKDRQGNIFTFISSRKNVRILKYDQRNRCFTEFATLTIPEKFAAKPINYFYIDSRNHCWLSLADKQLYVYDLPSSFTKKDQPVLPLHIFTSNAVNHIFEDKENNLWMATVDGLFFYDRSENKEYWYKNDYQNSTAISSDVVQHIFQDHTDILWIATANGLNKLNPLQRKFGNLTKAQNINKGLYNNFVLGVFPEGNEQLRIHYNIYENVHFTRYHIRNQNYKHIAYEGYDPISMIREVIVQNPEKLTNELLQKIIATFEKFDDPSWVNNGGFVKIWIDDQQQPWYDKSGFNSNPNWLYDTVISDMHLYGNDLWIASTKGLIQFNTLSQNYMVYTTAGPGTGKISSNDITCFLFEQKGNMWIGTKGGGLNFFDRQKNVFSHFTEKDGLCNNSIYCMVKDDNGNLWLGTSFGLSKFDPITKQFKNYFKADGLINNEYNRKSACKMPDGTIFMGGMNGIDYFHPDSLQNNTKVPAVVIADFKVFNKNIEPGRQLALRHSENFTTFEFAVMDFTNPAGNKFMYKLEGVDKNWVFLENRNFTAYSNLKPGSYRFLVKGANNDGVWNEAPTEYKFNILPAWYQTHWFLLLIILAIATAIYILFRYRLHQKLKLYAVRQRIHRDLHDDVGATLSSVKAYAELLKDNPDNPVVTELIQQNATEMIEKLEVITWATNPQHDHFKSLKSRMIKFASPLCHSKSIQFDVESNGINEEMIIPGEIRQNVFLVFKETINNMIKYAEATECTAKLFIDNNRFNVEIKDNGKGFDGNTRGNGSGWKNMQKRTEDLKGELVINSTPGKGTIITMSLPYPFKIPSSWDKNRMDIN